MKKKASQLTAYGGLELLRRYFQLIGLNQRLRRGFREHQLGGDFGCAHLVLLVIALLVVGARRLRHWRYVAGDPLFALHTGLLQRQDLKIELGYSIHFRAPGAPIGPIPRSSFQGKA